MQAGVAALEERRVGGDREQQRQHRPQPVADLDRTVGAADPDVHVHGERVVAPGHVLQPVLDPVVVVGVDDVLLAVVGPRVRAGRPEQHVVCGRELEQAPAHFALRATAACVASRHAPTGSRSQTRSARRRSRSEQDRVALRASRSSSKRATRPRCVGSRIANSSSMPTVKSVDCLEARHTRCPDRCALKPGRSRARGAGRRPGSKRAR